MFPNFEDTQPVIPEAEGIDTRIVDGPSLAEPERAEGDTPMVFGLEADFEPESVVVEPQDEPIFELDPFDGLADFEITEGDADYVHLMYQQRLWLTGTLSYPPPL
jgi:hypothetical protein